MCVNPVGTEIKKTPTFRYGVFRRGENAPMRVLTEITQFILTELRHRSNGSRKGRSITTKVNRQARFRRFNRIWLIREIFLQPLAPAGVAGELSKGFDRLGHHLRS